MQASGCHICLALGHVYGRRDTLSITLGKGHSTYNCIWTEKEKGNCDKAAIIVLYNISRGVKISEVFVLILIYLRCTERDLQYLSGGEVEFGVFLPLDCK